MNKIKGFIIGAVIGFTWIPLALLSIWVYKTAGYYDMLLAHPYMWGGSIAIMSFMVDWLFINSKLGRRLIA